MKTATGAELYEIIEHYASMGIHRTGTSVDDATAAWMADELADRGFSVEARPVSFDRWEPESRLTADGEAVDHLPVHHEWTGTIATDNVHVAGFDPMSGGFPGALAEPIASARAAGAEAAVLATAHPEGSLVGINRIIGAGSGFPTVLVAGREQDRLTGARVHLELDARLVPGETTNVVATNDLSGPPLLLTTPLTGWFTCAGERATGIAVLLHLVDRFRDRPLVVVATGGHELHYFGVRHWVDANELSPAAIVHVGASVAVDAPVPTGGRELVSTRLAMTDVEATAAAPMVGALAPIGLSLATDTEGWIGESEVFCEVGVPMLSFTGSGIDFHTPGDTPERATSPDALIRVAHAIGDATAALDSLVRGTEYP